MKKERIIAGFRCPVCDSEVYAVGFAWRCTRKGCGFTIGRSYKTDPDGTRYVPNRKNYEGPRDRYREGLGLAFEERKGTFPEVILYRFNRSYQREGEYWTVELYSETVWGEWIGDEKVKSRAGRTEHYYESLPKPTMEEALATAKRWLKANGGAHVRLREDISKR